MDKILVNGLVYTMDADHPEAEALAIKDGIIRAVGTNDEILAMKDAGTEVIDMNGGMLLPGLIDAHCHPAMTAYFLNALQFDEEMTLDEVLSSLRDYVEAHPDNETYFGTGYNEICFSDREYTTELLDEICPDKPVFLSSSGCHSAWVNACTFERAGITAETPDPIPGFQYFEKNAAGELTGHVVETEAENMIYRAIDFFDNDILEISYKQMAKEFSAYGITTLVGCGNFDWMGDRPYETADNLIRNGQLDVRIFDCAFLSTLSRKESSLEDIRRLSKRYDSDRLRVNTYKVIMDGPFESGSASMHEEYIPGYKCIPPLLEGRELEEIFLTAASEGYDIHAHGIGNYAIHEILRGAEAVRKAGYEDTRITCAHTQYVTKEDRRRFGELNVIANTTGGWHYWYPGIDTVMGTTAEDEFTLKEIIDGGTIMTMGSDRPADEVGFDPRMEIVTAMTRKYIGFLDDPELPTLKPDDQKLSLQECLESYTVNAAHQIHMDGKIGQIREGAYADLCLFARDMFTLTPEEILEDPLMMTMIEGKIVYEA
ncbi:MAG: amidohydrolase [Clostridiales bacterium]|nr:amidohydrolase [Clostridiales bacterium]MDD7035216.1 amidohydrolase [Bacillota bacterium]